ncbi:MAG: hypothetical protein WBD63_07640 [Phycisphaerae bacterium]|nr:hypothetical protein [Phycisphaerae bacterium]
MPTPPTGAPQHDRAATPTAGRIVRVLLILAVNVGLVIAATALGSAGGTLPDLTAETLAVHLLPVSAAMGLLLACRRLDFSLPLLFLAAATLRANSFAFPGDPWMRLLLLTGLAAGLALVTTIITWYGRIASALWTALVAVALWALVDFAKAPLLGGSAGWPWTAGVSAALGLLVLGAMLMGLARIVVPPACPPIFQTGSHGLGGLAAAWMVAAAAMVLAAGADAPKALLKAPWLAYPPVLAAAALGGAYVLRGRWGAIEAVVLTAVAHLAWAFTLQADLGDKALNAVVPVAAPLVAVPLYLLLDWLVRQRTGESAPTALVA